MQARGYVIAATGLAAEARLAASAENVVAVASGANETRLADLIEQALSDGARGIISFGIAGGLDPALPSGAVVIGTSVYAGARHVPADAAWTAQLRRSLPDAHAGQVAGCSTVIADPATKAEVFRATGAIAADMESHVVARIAEERELPFAVLRVIADAANQGLPPAAINGLKPDGQPDTFGVLKSLAADPAQLVALIRTGLAARRAMSGLLRCHRLLGPGLGYTDLG
ncbi:phosphorylase [Hyphomicrobium methylovorum]|uniref:phosphorylase family protein n=1 Tax=Hyphomicrobium methylovorum TaxID=84 RepID=UPI0015E6BF8E|nr:phosphorylase [Hyphomicrobium methylovorum]MBA2125481.1 phosphorylase [Hyphomicrobium methylovorum]